MGSSLSLAVLCRLKTVSLRDNCLSAAHGGLWGLVVFASVTRLDLRGNHIRWLRDLEPLRLLSRLESLELSGNSVTETPNYWSHVLHLFDRNRQWRSDGSMARQTTAPSSRPHQTSARAPAASLRLLDGMPVQAEDFLTAARVVAEESGLVQRMTQQHTLVCNGCASTTNYFVGF